MTIPRIEPYLLPTASLLPPSRAPWAAEPARAVLLVHDMQSYFLDFFARDQSPVRELLRNIARLRAQCDRLGVPVVYSAQPADRARARRGLLQDMWGDGLTAHPEREAIVPELTPRASETVLVKTRYSAFFGTELETYLRARGRDQLWICGVFAHIGGMVTAFDAFMRDLKPFLISDALADFSEPQHRASLAFVADSCGVVIDTDALCAPETPEVHALLTSELSALGVQALDVHAELTALGLDSVRRMELLERLRGRGLMLPAADVLECQTLAELTRAVAEALDAASAVAGTRA